MVNFNSIFPLFNLDWGIIYKYWSKLSKDRKHDYIKTMSDDQLYFFLPRQLLVDSAILGFYLLCIKTKHL